MAPRAKGKKTQKTRKNKAKTIPMVRISPAIKKAAFRGPLCVVLPYRVSPMVTSVP
jgi:hypothetical protein